MKKRYIFLPPLIMILVVFGIVILVPPYYSYQQSYVPVQDNFDDYYAALLEKSKEQNVRPDCEERLIRFADKTDLVILYIHGFSASRAEGEMVVGQLAEQYQANTFYLRLPGHGTNPEDHAAAKFSDYLDYSIQALQMSQELGDKVIVVGTSMGGLVASHLAAEYPDLVDGLVLASPFYDYAHWAGTLLKIPGVLQLGIMINGKYRKFGKAPNWEARRQEGYYNYWYEKQYNKALGSLENLRCYTGNSNTYKRITSPLLMLYYYKDAENQDAAASVAAMRQAFDQFSTPDAQKRQVAIADADHVLLSEYIRTDKETILKELTAFLDGLNSK